jgi:PAS domain S-box-containing protein
MTIVNPTGPQPHLEQLQFAANAVPALIAYLDTDARYVWVNEAYRRWFGYDPEWVRGRLASEVLGEPAFELVRPYVERALAGEEVTFDQRLAYRSGPARDVRATYSPHFNADGTVRGFVVLSNDVSEIRATEQALRRSEDQLRDADRRKDEFLAMLSHELRNPLAPILNAVDLLDRTLPGHADRFEMCRAIIARQVLHMKRLLDDLLDVSRVSQGKVQLRKEQVQLGAIISQAIELSRPLMSEKRQELSVSVPPDPLHLDADPTPLLQVFANLLNNAAKFTGAGGHISVAVAVENGEAVVKVRDDGIGMQPDLLANAFDLFVQGTRSLDRAQGGLGIGLTMVRTLVEMHGGWVRAFSEGSGKGSEFVVGLALLPSSSATASSDASPPAKPSTRSLRVLVVDDNVDAAQSLGNLLELLGHQVKVTNDGPTALAAASELRPEVVLLDIGLPGMDGFAVAAQLRAQGLDRASLIALSGYGQEGSQRSKQAGFDRYLLKPIDLGTLEDVLSKSV